MMDFYFISKNFRNLIKMNIVGTKETNTNSKGKQLKCFNPIIPK